MTPLSKLLDLSPENLAKEQAEALTNYAVNRLREIALYLAKGNYGAVRDCLFFSGSGDCMGSENHCIEFPEVGEYTDLGMIVERLVELEKIQNTGGRDDHDM